MKSRYALGSLILLLALLATLTGCSKREDARAGQEEGAAVAGPEAAGQSVPPLIAQFLDRRVRMRNVTAGGEIRAFFASWEEALRRRPREPMDLHFEVDVDGTFPRDHAWENPTSRGILEEVCQECDLVWTMASPNTIRISKKPRP